MKDKEIQKLIALETKRQKETLDLIASENLASHDVLEPLSTPLSNKYSEGYPGRRYYPGNIYNDKIERLAQERALKLFKLNPKKWSVNVQPYSGSPANLAVYLGLVEPGETIMGMKLAAGGHLTHGHKVSATGIFYNSVQYGVDEKTGMIDYNEVLRLAKKARPKIIVSGFTAYPRAFNFKKFGIVNLENKKELDVGCGKSLWLTLLMKNQGASVTGIDTEASKPGFLFSKYYNTIIYYNVME